MLESKKSVNLNGTSKIGDTVVETFAASINSENPKDITYSNYIQNRELYWNNLEEVEADEKAFKKLVKETRDEMSK